MELHYGALIPLVLSVIASIVFGVFAWLREDYSQKKYRDTCIACLAIVIALFSFVALISK